MILSPDEKKFCTLLGLRLREARLKKRVKQSDLAARAGVSWQLIIRMEKVIRPSLWENGLV